MNKSAWHEKNKERVREYMREYHRKRRAENPERHKAAVRKSYTKNREKYLIQMRARYVTHKWSKHLEKKYGVTAARYVEMLERQEGKCAICGGGSPGGRGSRFHVDHCHATGRVRDLLCTLCNRMLGMAHDKPEILHEAARYLTKHSAIE